MRLLRALALVAVFCFDVHVKASEAGNDCLSSAARCAITAREKRVFENDGLRMAMAGDSLLEHRNSSLIELVRGEFYIEASHPVVFNTPYVKIWCDEECKGLFHRESDTLTLKSLEGHWLARRVGEKQIYTVPAGFQVEFGEVTVEGAASMEFPQSLPWTPTVNEWASLYPGRLEDFKPTLVKFRAVWHQAVEAVSVLHKQAADRAIASNSRALADERARRLAIEREDKSLRDLFHEKNP